MSEEIFQWTVPEYVTKEHSPDWYWGVSLAGLALAGIGIVTGNPLFAIFIVIAVATVFFFHRREPGMLDCGISKKGVRINETVHPFKTIESFYVRESLDPEREPRLVLKSHKKLMPLIVVPLPDELDDEDLEELQIYLSQFITEEEHPEQLSEQIMDRLGF
jgi:hypothetical protein